MRDPARYRDYVQRSSAELSPAQGIYVDTRSGWFSDRTAAYLASGRPAVVQDTGQDLVPTGEGLLTFRTADEAEGCVRDGSLRLGPALGGGTGSRGGASRLGQGAPARSRRCADVSAPRESTPFSFAVLGDCQPALPRTPLSQVTHQIMRELRLLRPELVLYTGDRIWGYRESRQEMLNAYDRFRALTDTVGVPFLMALGNHEMQSDPAAVESRPRGGKRSVGLVRRRRVSLRRPQHRSGESGGPGDRGSVRLA